MIEDKYSTFFKEINARENIAKDFDKKYSKALAVEFNAFDFMKWDENKVSQILAYFLDPNETHQQGNVYLKIFIKDLALNFPYSEDKSIFVKREESTFEKRRVDILVSYNNNERLIGIENKIYPWTADQKDQVKDYLIYLQSIAKTENYQLIYLAPKSKFLTEYSAGENFAENIDSGKILIINYEEHIIPMIKKFIINTENLRVRSFLEDFEQRLKENYLGKENIKSTMVQNYLLENPHNLEKAFDVANSLNSVKLELQLELHKQMNSLAVELNIVYDEAHRHFEIPSFTKYNLKYSFEMGGVIYGVVKKPQFMIDNPEKVYINGLDKFLGVKFNTSAWWPLYFLQYDKIDHNPKFWVDIINGNFKAFMRNFIQNTLIGVEELKLEL